MRISGLASGLNVDSMVEELMKAKRKSYDNMIKKRAKVEWQQDDYRNMSSKIVDFRNNKLFSYNTSTAISAKTSEVSGDTKALTVNSTSSTSAGTLTVNVVKVATAATNVYKFGSGDLESLGFTEDPDNIDNVMVDINGKKLSLKKTDSLGDLATLINSNVSTIKATALYNDATGQFSISATQTGEGKLMINEFSSSYISAVENDGVKAEISVNGITYKQDTNRYSINGIDFTVKEQSVTPTTIAVSKDISKTLETIKSFVSEYNALISAINSELSETKNRGYDALTTDEKKEMSDSEIEIWEAKARSGTLRNDATLSQMLTEMRAATTTLIGGIKDGNGNTIMSIGITTGSYTEKGKLVIDEDKLRAALEAYPDETSDLFSSQSTGVFTKMSTSAMTALTSLSAKAGTSLTSKETTTSFLESSLLSTQIREMKTREQLMLDRLNMMETQYFKQFSAMESAINKFNSQSSSLSSL
jgi:flagellar hook-associated protein 2